MKKKCNRCKKTCNFQKMNMRKDNLAYAEKGVYFCRPCRHEIVIIEMEKILNDKRRRNKKIC